MIAQQRYQSPLFVPRARRSAAPPPPPQRGLPKNAVQPFARLVLAPLAVSDARGTVAVVALSDAGVGRSFGPRSPGYVFRLS
jgi:hypothetical protein